MKKNIILRTNFFICVIITVGFLLIAVLSYKMNYGISVQNIEQVSALSSDGIYYQMTNIFTKPVNISLTMANDELLKDLLLQEEINLEDASYITTIKNYLKAYQEEYGYDSVFLISVETGRYYNFSGLDRILTTNNPENEWYYNMLYSSVDYSMNIDNDEAGNNDITLFVNCKIKDNTGKILGIVGVGLRIDALQSILQSYEDEFFVDTVLIDDDGFIQISPHHTGFEKINYFANAKYDDNSRDQILSWNQDNEAYQFWATLYDKKREDVCVVVRYLPDLNWYLVVERNDESSLQALRFQLLQTCMIITVIIILILFLVTRLIRRYNRQIILLTKKMEQERRNVFRRATEELFENIYELNITKNCPANQITDQYYQSLGASPNMPFDQSLKIVAEKQVKPEFRQAYIDTFCPENVLRAYQEERDTLQLDLMISTDSLEYYWIRITGRIMRLETDNSIHLFTYRQNINAQKQQENRMEKLVQTDETTGCYTKAAIQKQIIHRLESEEGKHNAFLIIDIDDFKQANDQLGHAFGDAVIVNFVKKLHQHFSQTDLIGRIGGDEFVIFLPFIDEPSVRKKIADLSKSLHYVHIEGEKSWTVSASIGVSLSPEEGVDFLVLYKCADIALYRTKANGKGGYTFNKDIK